MKCIMDLQAIKEKLMSCFRIIEVVLTFILALVLGALKALVFGPIASVVLIAGNISIILGLFPAHVVWTIQSLLRTPLFDIGLKIVLILLALPPVGAVWLAISIVGSFLAGIGYGYFTPWVATFEAFRQDSRSDKCVHCLVDGTWSTIKGSTTIVRDFLDLCYHSYRSYLKEFEEKSSDCGPRKTNLLDVPACFVVGLVGLVAEVVLFTAIVIVKSPYMLLRGWQRLLHDLISREGPFFETACIPIAGLFLLLWPLFVIACGLIAILSSFFVGLYGAVIAYQESSFLRGMAYIIAIAAEFDEYSNDSLYLREGTCLPRPNYRKKKLSKSSNNSSTREHSRQGSVNSRSQTSGGSLTHGNILPSLTASRSVRETIQEVKMVQVWEDTMKTFEILGKEFINTNILGYKDFEDWLKSSKTAEKTIVGTGLPSYCLLFLLLRSIRTGSAGLLMANGIEITPSNRPQDRFMDWFFNPLLVLRDQIRASDLEESELKYLEKLTLMSYDLQRMTSWENGGAIPNSPLRMGEIQAVSRRLQGMTRNIAKFPTYRRRYQGVVKTLLTHAYEKEKISKSRTSRKGSLRGDSYEHSKAIEVISAFDAV